MEKFSSPDRQVNVIRVSRRTILAIAQAADRRAEIQGLTLLVCVLEPSIYRAHA